jgi:multidrug efflux pump subunit AcrB
VTPASSTSAPAAPPAASCGSASSPPSSLSVSLAVVQLVVLKMLPFDNKSEFQVVLDMPAGTPLEDTARVLREIGAEIAKVPEVTDYQAYAGTASPINFNGLVRQYYLRASSELGDIQVNLVDKKHRSRQSHEIAVSVRDGAWPPSRSARRQRQGGRSAARPAGAVAHRRRDLRPRLRRPGRRGEAGAQGLRGHRRHRRRRRLVQADAQKFVLRVSQSKAALLGVAQKDIVEVVRMGLAGENVTPVHSQRRQVRDPGARRLPPSAGQLDALLKLTVRGARRKNGAGLRAGGSAPSFAREKAIYHKDLLPVVYVTGDMGGKLDSPLYGMFDIRSGESAWRWTLEQGGTLGEYFIRQPKDPYAGYSLKWDGEWQVTYETFRDMGLAYAVGLILIYLLVVAQFKSYLVPLIIMAPIPLTIIGVMPGHALLGSQFTATSMIGMIALAGIIVRNSILLVDFINEQVAGGMDFAEAVIQAAAIRAKPIALTGLAAMIGAHLHPRRPDLQRPRHQPDLRHLRVDPADAGGDPGALLRGDDHGQG